MKHTLSSSSPCKRKPHKDFSVTPLVQEYKDKYGDILSMSGSVDATPEELAKMLMSIPARSQDVMPRNQFKHSHI